MPPKNLIFQRLLLSIYLLIGVLIPGSSLLLANKHKWAFTIPLLGVIWVGLMSWTRWVITPTGFAVMLSGLVLLHFVSYIIGYYLKPKIVTPSTKHGLALVVLILLNTSIAVSCHIYKDQWFGFAFYHIPSDSMSPALETSDVVMVDTWAYRRHSPQVNDIVVFYSKTIHQTQIKRVFAIEGSPVFYDFKGNVLAINNQTGALPTLTVKPGQLFLAGDNLINSSDSRHYGTVSASNALGQARLLLLNVSSWDNLLAASERFGVLK